MKADRHREERSDEAIQGAGEKVGPVPLDCFAALAMTAGAEAAQRNLCVIPDKPRSGADPEAIVGWRALRWIPGQARNDGEVQRETDVPAAWKRHGFR